MGSTASPSPLECPVCLQRTPALDRAVVSTCLHAFCVTCLATWVGRKRSCPVCRGAVPSFFHSIASELDYQEFTCRSPTAVHEQQQQHEPHVTSASTALSNGGSSSSSRAASRVQLRTQSFTSWGDPQDARGGAGQHRGSPAARSTSSSSRGQQAPPQQQQQPRPYFWRLQQHMMSSMQHTSSIAGPPGGPSQAALQARRAIYAQNLWAQPHQPRTAAGTGSSSSSSSSRGGSVLPPRVSQGSLQSWLERELQALLCDHDVGLLAAYVRGLINTLNILNIQPPRAGASGQLDAVAALQGFLFERSAHFWHELSAFCSSGLTVAAWDRAVEYRPRPSQQQPEQQQPQPQPPAAAPADDLPPTQQQEQAAARSRKRRWDVAPSQTVQQGAAGVSQPQQQRGAGSVTVAGVTGGL